MQYLPPKIPKTRGDSSVNKKERAKIYGEENLEDVELIIDVGEKQDSEQKNLLMKNGEVL